MEVEYTLGIDEVLALSLYHGRHSPLLRRRVWLARLLVPAIVLLVWLLFAVSAQNVGAVVVIGAVCAIAAFVLFLRIPSMVRRSTVRSVRRLYAESPNRGAFGRRRMTITPETLTEAGELTVTTKKWAAIDKIVEDHAHAYFYVSALSAFILPKWAFATEEDFHNYVETARRYQREAPPA